MASSEKQDNESSDNSAEQESPLQRINIFIWKIFNILRNLNVLKQWLQIRYGNNNNNRLQYKSNVQLSEQQNLPALQ